MLVFVLFDTISSLFITSKVFYKMPMTLQQGQHYNEIETCHKLNSVGNIPRVKIFSLGIYSKGVF